MSYFKIEGGQPLNGTITPSGNKNEALPALMTCLLTDEPIILHNMPKIRDVLTACEILEDMGVQVAWSKENTLKLEATSQLGFKIPNRELCTRIRASILLLGPMLARFKKVELPLPGGDAIGARKLDVHFECVEALGGHLELSDTIHGAVKHLKGTELFLDEPSVTATENVLLLSVLAEGVTTIYNAACEPHVKGLCRLLISMGAKIEGVGTNSLTVTGVSKLHGTEHTISPDFMEVASFLCLGAITEGTLTIDKIVYEDLRFMLKVFKRLGINPDFDGKDKLTITKDKKSLVMEQAIGNQAPLSIFSGPWPAFPTDVMSVAMVAATQSYGTMLFHEKMFEGRMFFTDKLISMGANLVLCDPHRVVITGPRQLHGIRVSSPDVRAGMAVLIATLAAKGTSEIHNVYQIDRGYQNIEEKIQKLGGKILRFQN